MKYRYTALALALAAVGTLHAQTTRLLSTSKANEYGLTYSLPTTVVDITFETTHTEQTPGQFYKYANRYLGTNDVIAVPEKSATVTSVVINPRGVANPSTLYLSRFKAGANVTMTLTDSDTPLAINTTQTETYTPTPIPKPVAAQPTPLETEAAHQAVTQEMSAATTLSKKAELAAQRIFELRDTRNELLSGSAENMPPDGQALKLILDNISAQESALMAMFVGTSRSYTTVNTITYCPTPSGATDTIIARISPDKGIIDSKDLSGEPIRLTLTDVVLGKLPLTERGEPRELPKGGVIYNIPGSAVLNISLDDQQLATKPLELNQFGVTFGLEPSLFTDKKRPSYVIFSPLTGGIVRLGFVDEQ